MTTKEVAIANAPENTGQKQNARFQPGQSGNPLGRPKGSRNRVSERFLEALANHFDAHGEAAIDKVCKERPHDYLKIVASVLPKRMELEEAASQRPLHQMTDDELEAMIWKTSQQLRAQGINPEPTEDEIAQVRARRLDREPSESSRRPLTSKNK